MEGITSRTGSAHVTSTQFRSIFEGIVGEGSYIANMDNKLSAEVGTGNKIFIRSGILIHHGNIFRVPANTYDEVSYDSGAQGLYRKDLIVARHTINGDGTETDAWVVLKGTPNATESRAVRPDYTHGNMQDGDSVDDCPVFEIQFNGLNITRIVPLVSVISAVSNINATAQTKAVNVHLPNQTSVSAVGVNITVPSYSGYKAVGLIGWYLTGEKASDVYMPNAYISTTNNLYVYLKTTTGTASLSTASYFTILYIKE